ncbi:PREDICTED: protein sidekick-2 [Chrysochloris asiatica]|uniref:Protein sidekick-2 n=1 Tax=Chrysochloris asiatica TaxID=185453 RepID=A0A9B0WZ39_CHRAS|nr:PREDICTED: protein sidekick-2 [Chrysochloris asiatica]
MVRVGKDPGASLGIKEMVPPLNDVAPYFKTEPVRTQVHLEGNRLVLTCMAEGSWPLEFKWLHNKQELTKFSLEYRYMITSLDRTHAGFYRCVVRNRMGALLQRQTEVQVAYMGSFEESEKRQSVSHGEAAVIRAPRIASFPQPQVTWFRDGRKIPPSSRIAITLENTLVILSTVAPDAGRYYVQAVNDKNGDNKTSQPVTLAVENVGGPADPIAPSIIIPPKNTSVVVGTSEVTLECVANARPLIKLHIIWKKDGILLSGGISDFNRRLTIPNPTSSDAGYYECQAALHSSSVPAVVRGAYLSVLEPPQFTKEPARHITAEMEKVVDIPCRAKGVPPPSITWYKDAAVVEVERLSRFRLRGDGGLQISGLVPDDTGMFQCFARNAAGEVQTSTYLAVTSIAPNITRGPLDSTVIDGMSVVLACETSGAPRPAITWQKGERILASGSIQLPRFTLLESGSLLVSPTHISDAGTYTCLATNSRGVDEASADLVVWARTRITKPPQDQSVIKGTQASMVCGVTHDPRVTTRYVWEKDGTTLGVESNPRIRLHKNGSLHISQTWSGDIGTYTCRVLSAGGNDSRSAHLRVRQLPHAPEHPVATLSTGEKRAINLTWAKPFDGNSPLIRYILEMSENNAPWTVLLASVDPDTTSVTVKDLVPARSYQFRLCAVNDVGKGQFSKDTERVSLPEEPPTAPPQNVIASGRTNQSIMIQWQPPPESHQNGLLKGYIIRYCLAGLPVGYQFKNITDADINNLLLEELIIWTNYEIEVAAYNSAGLGIYSSKVTEWTLQGVPTVPPSNVQAEATNSTAIRFTWNAPSPQFINGINQGYKVPGAFPTYQITHRLNATTANTATVEVLAPSARQYTATGLKPEAVYLFRITAQTRKGWGEAAEALVVTTEKRDRPQPPSKPVVQQEDVKARSVFLSWEPGSDGLSPVRYYTVQMRELPSGRWVLHSASISHNASSFVVDRLKPFTSYKFRVKATNDIGDSEFSEESESLTTLQAAPDEAPTILSVLPHTTTSVLIRWQPPAEDKINGILLGFRIRYRELLYEGLRGFTLRGVHNPGAKWAELTSLYSTRNLSRPSLTQYELDNLNKHRRYEIRMSVYNAVGEGPSSPPQEVFVGEAVPTAAPRNVVVHGATATQLDVMWEPPPLESQNGDIQGYKIYFWEAQRRNLTERVKTLFLPENSVKLKNLTGYTAYMVSVAAFNAAGDGPRSTPTRGQTQQAAPSAPGSVKFSELTTTSVNVSWEAPKFPNGVLEGYRLVYEPCTPVDGVSKIVTVDVKGSSPLWLKVKDLVEGMTYRFRIRAKTFTYGPEIEANVTTGPGEGAPGPPGMPIIVRYSSAIAIHWSSGDPGKGPITRYVLEARPSDEGLWDILIKDIPKEVTSYTFSMDILKPGVSYDFRVIAVNDYGFGTPSSPSQSVPAQKANPFYEEWWFLVVIALVGLIFILLLVFVLIIRGQSKKYTKKTDSGNNAKSGALGHGEMLSLDESSFPALELNNRRLSVKNSFCRKNGLYTRSPPRPSPGSLHYSDEDVTKYNDLIPAESSSLTEKPSEISDSQGSDSEYEADPSHQKAHSFVNHYISDPTYYNSWRRQQKGISRAQAYSYTESDPGEPDHATLANSNSTQQGSLFRPKASRTPTPQNPPNPPSQQSALYRPPSSLAPGSRAPIAGFSSFV